MLGASVEVMVTLRVMGDPRGPKGVSAEMCQARGSRPHWTPNVGTRDPGTSTTWVSPPKHPLCCGRGRGCLRYSWSEQSSSLQASVLLTAGPGLHPTASGSALRPPSSQSRPPPDILWADGKTWSDTLCAGRWGLLPLRRPRPGESGCWARNSRRAPAQA